jgi:hypothetical protein
MKNSKRVALALEQYTYEVLSKPNMIEGVLEVCSYEEELLLEFYSKIKLVNPSIYITNKDKIKKIISLLNEHVRTNSEPLIKRLWDKSISGVETIFYIPLDRAEQFKKGEK